MFEWLVQEISAVKTPRFHVVEGPASVKLQRAVIGSAFPLPSAYKEFVLRFGNAKLYRNSRNDSYYIGIFAAPREAMLDDGTRIFHVGFHDSASVYVKILPESPPFSIFEFESGSEKQVASDFEEWLSATCATARNRYGKKKWAEIMRGPVPFSAEEKNIIKARRMMRWKVLGIDANGNHIFEVTNTGQGGLAALTVGIRSKDGRLNGAVRLNVRNVRPGQTALLHASCYKDIIPPEDVKVFALPDPQPEDRDYFWELQPI